MICQCQVPSAIWYVYACVCDYTNGMNVVVLLLLQRRQNHFSKPINLTTVHMLISSKSIIYSLHSFYTIIYFIFPYLMCLFVSGARFVIIIIHARSIKIMTFQITFLFIAFIKNWLWYRSNENDNLRTCILLCIHKRTKKFHVITYIGLSCSSYVVNIWFKVKPYSKSEISNVKRFLPFWHNHCTLKSFIHKY